MLGKLTSKPSRMTEQKLLQSQDELDRQKTALRQQEQENKRAAEDNMEEKTRSLLTVKLRVQESKAQRQKRREDYLVEVEQAYIGGKAAEENKCKTTITQKREKAMAKVTQIWAEHDKEVDQLQASSKALVGQMMGVRDTSWRQL